MFGVIIRQYAFFGVSSRDISATMADGNENPSEFDLKLIMKQSLEDLYDNACQLFEERKRIWEEGFFKISRGTDMA